MTQLNPGQTPVNICDQSIYAFSKQIQWSYPHDFINYFTFFGALHMEKSLLVVHSDFVKGSGLSEVLGVCNISVSGLENAMISVSDIKKATYALQVSVCTIYQKLAEAHAASDTVLPVWDWLKRKSEHNVMCNFTFSSLFVLFEKQI